MFDDEVVTHNDPFQGQGMSVTHLSLERRELERSFRERDRCRVVSDGKIKWWQC